METAPYDTTIDDLRDVSVDGEPQFELPSGDPVTTELDRWARRVHSAIADWLRRPFRADQEASPVGS
jgi:hypothetical protein